MKRSIYVLFFLCLMIFPFNINAANITDVKMNSNGTIKSGEQIVVTLTATISNYAQNEGIWLAYTELTYNSSQLALVQITSPGYNTVVEYGDDKATLTSIAIENANTNNTCVGGLLQCGNYVLNLKFQATNISTTIDTSIVASEFAIGALAITENREYTVDDIDERNYHRVVSHTLKLEPNSNSLQEKTPTVVAEKQVSTGSSKKTSNTTSVVSTKSSNNYLESLQITDYGIDFNKDTVDCSVTINKEATSLNIKPVVEDKTSSYQISGNEKLEDGSLIKITVIAEDGNTKEYNINIKKDTASAEDSEKFSEHKKETYENPFKKVIIGVCTIIGLIILVGAIIIINDIRDRRKLNKLLKDEK